jgi:L-amino acid N-acyltransferase YncA
LKLLELIRPEGKRRLLGYVDHLNYASLRGVEKSGYVQVGVLRGIKRQGKTNFQLSVDCCAWSEAIRAGPCQH